MMKITMHKENYLSPKTITLPMLLESIRSGKYAKSVQDFRQSLDEYYSPEMYPEKKKPAIVIFSGTFRKEGHTFTFRNYTGIILLEVNHLAGQDEVRQVRQKASESLQTLAAFEGLSGRSVKILIRFTLPDGSLPADRDRTERFHAHAYHRAVDYYRMQLGREITLKTPIPERGCRLSYDPNLYYNPEAAVVTMEQPLQMPVETTWKEQLLQQTNPLDRLLPGWEQDKQYSFLFHTALRKTLDERDISRSDDDPETILVSLAENCFQSGLPEEETVKRARMYSEWGSSETQVRAIIGNTYRTGKNFGNKINIPPMQRMALQMEEFMRRRYDIRRNVMKNEVEYRERASIPFRFLPVTEEALNSFSLQSHKEGLDFWDRDIKRYVRSHHIPPYNPIDDYLENLPEWDGTDHIRMLADTIPTANSFWREGFYRWFLGMVAQWQQYNRRHGNSVVPLLVGSQATGKSTWCRNILPPELRDYYTDSLDLGNKRNAELALNRFALINLDEFDSIPIGKQPFLKHLVQKPEIHLRRPHKSSIEVLPRYATFIATCNNFDLLSDPTGNRRYLCVEVDNGIDYHTPIHYGQLYAQAKTALRKGERYWLNNEDEKILNESNAAFEQLHPEEQYLLRLFRPASIDESQGQWLSPIEILRYIQDQGKIKSSHTTITFFGRILRKHRFPRKHTSTGNVYKVEYLALNEAAGVGK